jgi:hypothetical protein
LECECEIVFAVLHDVLLEDAAKLLKHYKLKTNYKKSIRKACY